MKPSLHELHDCQIRHHHHHQYRVKGGRGRDKSQQCADSDSTMATPASTPPTMRTAEPNVGMHASNLLLVRTGAQVATDPVAALNAGPFALRLRESPTRHPKTYPPG
jgi:hypothetical protein